MKLVGMIFIVVSAGSVGFRIAVLLKRRCMLVRQFLRALQLLRSEISFCGTPLPQAFALMAANWPGCFPLWRRIWTAGGGSRPRLPWKRRWRKRRRSC